LTRNNLLENRATIETYNRFKDLQRRYALPFEYSSKPTDVEINCAVSYLPFEGRIDRVTFELLLHKAQPKELIMINSASSKIKHVQLYCAANKVNTHV